MNSGIRSKPRLSRIPSWGVVNYCSSYFGKERGNQTLALGGWILGDDR